MGERKGVYRVLVGKLEGKRSIGRPRRRCEDGIKIELSRDMDRWQAFINAVMNLRVP
jgi:hypothetical protein